MGWIVGGFDEGTWVSATPAGFATRKSAEAAMRGQESFGVVRLVLRTFKTREEKGAPDVDEADALFMIGACSAFVSYLISKARLVGPVGGANCGQPGVTGEQSRSARRSGQRRGRHRSPTWHATDRSCREAARRARRCGACPCRPPRVKAGVAMILTSRSHASCVSSAGAPFIGSRRVAAAHCRHSVS
jgi:hypothetical protein